MLRAADRQGAVECGSDLKAEIRSGAKLRIAASTFSIFAFESLRQELEQVEELAFIFTSPTFVAAQATEPMPKERREFSIPHGRAAEVSLYNRKAVYQVDFDSDELIGKCVDALDRHLNVNALQYVVKAGDYNPDWAIVFRHGAVKHVYFVAETKGLLSSLQLRHVEETKIECARQLFASLVEAVRYDVVTDYSQLLQLVGT